MRGAASAGTILVGAGCDHNRARGTAVKPWHAFDLAHQGAGIRARRHCLSAADGVLGLVRAVGSSGASSGTRASVRKCLVGNEKTRMSKAK